MNLSPSRLGELLDLACRVRGTTGKGIPAQAFEILRLRFGSGRLGVSGYYDYGLFDDDMVALPAKRHFIDARVEDSIYERLNHKSWRAIADDKLVFYSILQGAGLPFPKIYAIYRPGGRFFGSVPCFLCAAYLSEFLRTKMPYPFFAKPVQGAYGVGAVGVMAFDQARDRLILADDREVEVDQYVAGLPNPSGFGHLFQEYLTPHPTLGDICGNHVSSVRLIVLLCSDGPTPLWAAWKITTGRNMTDNFFHGTSGNLISQVDINTGLVLRAIKGVGLEQSEVAVHPDTSRSLTGFVLPHWKKLVEVCLKGAAMLPGLRLQSWDIAICPGGPVILEDNARGGLKGFQPLFGRGIYEEWFREAVARLLSPQGLTITQLGTIMDNRVPL